MSLSQAIHDAGFQAKADSFSKKLLLSRELIVPIIRTHVEEFAGSSDEEIWNSVCHAEKENVSIPVDQDTAVSMDTVDKSAAEGEILFDILLDVQVPHGEKIRLFIDLESQQNTIPDMR